MDQRPKYALAEVKQLIDAGHGRVTGTAEADARNELGLTRAGVLACINELCEGDFYKSMPSEKDAGLFQDVYRHTFRTPFHQGGIEVYCKVQIKDGRAVVISFKRR